MSAERIDGASIFLGMVLGASIVAISHGLPLISVPTVPIPDWASYPLAMILAAGVVFWRQIRVWLRSPGAADTKFVLELLGIPLALIGLYFTWAATADAFQQGRMDREEIARSILFDSEKVLLERYRALGSLISLGVEVRSATLGCKRSKSGLKTSTCITVKSFRAQGPVQTASRVERISVSAQVFSEATVSNVDFIGVKMRGTVWYESRFSDVRFDAGDLRRADFAANEMDNVRFENSDLTSTDFRGTDLSTVTFAFANISGMLLCDEPGETDMVGCAVLNPETTLANSWYREGSPPIGLEKFSPPIKLGWVCPRKLDFVESFVPESPGNGRCTLVP